MSKRDGHAEAERRILEREADAMRKRAEVLDKLGWLDDVEGRTDHKREDEREKRYERDHPEEFK